MKFDGKVVPDHALLLSSMRMKILLEELIHAVHQLNPKIADAETELSTFLSEIPSMIEDRIQLLQNKSRSGGGPRRAN